MTQAPPRPPLPRTTDPQITDAAGEAVDSKRDIARPSVFEEDRRVTVARSPHRRKLRDASFRWFCIAVASVSVLILLVLLSLIFYRGFEHLNWSLLTHGPDQNNPENSGLFPSLMGTVWVCCICAVVALLLGIATAIFMEEFRPRHQAAPPPARDH